MFARRAAAEILAGNNYFLTGDVCLGVKAVKLKILKKVGFERLLRNLSQVFCRNDFVRVDVGTIQEKYFSTKFFHHFPRYSDELVIVPAIAVAAAVAGLIR